MKEHRLWVPRLREAKFRTKIGPVIGAVAGLITRRLIRSMPPFATVGNMILGIAGGVVGGYSVACLVSARGDR